MRTLSFRMLLAASAVPFFSMLFESREARAQTMRWESAPIYSGGILGCASAIAVGANNDPVIIGCDGRTAFYTNPDVRYCPTGGNSCKGGPGVLGAPTYPTWTALTSHAAKYIALNLAGNLFIADPSGVLGYADGTGTGNGGFSGSFTMIATGGCITSIVAATTTSSPNRVVFETPTGQGITPNVWGVGCGGNPNSTLWQLAIDLTSNSPAQILGSTEWQQLGASVGNAASQIALFSDLNGDVVTQNPWVVADGGVYFLMARIFKGSRTHRRGSRTSRITTPLQVVTSITGMEQRTVEVTTRGAKSRAWTPRAARSRKSRGVRPYQERRWARLGRAPCGPSISVGISWMRSP